jgi:tetratricopeptide (TPR) repeat protein
MKKFLIACIILFFVIICSALFSQEVPSYQAIITDIQGSVQIKRAHKTDFVKAVWGTQLFAGDQLKTLDQSSVSILFSNNNLITLETNSSMTIAQNQLRSAQNTAPLLDLSNQFPEKVPLLSFRMRENGEVSALGGLRSRDSEEIILISPRNSKLSSLSPEFTWQSYKEYEHYKLTLFDDRGKLWTRDVEGTQYEFEEADEKLVYGKSYFWYVEGQNLFETKRSESIGFQVPAENEFRDISKRAEEILKLFENNPRSNSFQLVIGVYYEKEGYYGDAIASYQKIAQMNEDAPLPHQILGNLYQKIGLKDMAINELQKAVELSSESD